MFKPSDLFDLANWQFRDIFGRVDCAWSALPAIHDYVLGVIASNGARKPVLPGVSYMGEEIFIHPDAVVEPNVYIKAPTYIDAGVEIRSGAYIRGDALISTGAIVGHSTEVKNSIFLPHAHAPHFNYVGDSILGRHTNLGAGTKLSNWKIAADKTIHIKVEGQDIDTGLNKFGAILGDGAEMGCNSVANPGTVIGRGTLVYACAAIRGYFPPHHIVKLVQELMLVEKRPE
jgi:UDP-N-acetylglucosamine diphosphorylase / glucose-1-phosphate thymidylyltransferase / UDP-N-acetylgalactosamine diphosphorylase / glucosamine-1-phosphate N-acetyltransferase / galactosamine-1-phosphate N-acetyltransferase